MAATPLGRHFPIRARFAPRFPPCAHPRATPNASFPRLAAQPCHPCDIGPCRAGRRKCKLSATRGGQPSVTAAVAAKGGEHAEDKAQVPPAAELLSGPVLALVSASAPRRSAHGRPLLAPRRRRPRTLTDSLTRPMSMYTQLLDAAIEQRSPRDDEAGRDDALDEVRRCYAELEAGLPGGDVDTVSAVLALQVGYDVALVELAAVMGIASGPSRFEQPERERERLRTALRDLGIVVDAADDPPSRAEADRLADLRRQRLRCPRRRSGRPARSARADAPRTSPPASGAPCPASPAGSRRSSSPSSRPGTWSRRSGGWCSPRR